MVKQEKWNMNYLKNINNNKVNDLFFLFKVSKVCARLICSGGICPGGIYVQKVYVLGGICLGGKCPGGLHVRGGGGLCPRYTSTWAIVHTLSLPRHKVRIYQLRAVYHGLDML